MTRIIPRTRNTMHGSPAFICGGASDFGFAGLYLPIRCSRLLSYGGDFGDEKLSVYYPRGCLLAGCGTECGAEAGSSAVGVARMEARVVRRGRPRLRQFRATARRSAGRPICGAGFGSRSGFAGTK